MKLVATWHPVSSMVIIDSRSGNHHGGTHTATTWAKAIAVCRRYVCGIDATIELRDSLNRWNETIS